MNAYLGSALVGQILSTPVTVLSQFWDEPRLWVDLSDGRQVCLRWDSTHAYVGVSVHASEDDSAGVEVVTVPGLADFELEGLKDQVLKRVGVLRQSDGVAAWEASR